MTECERAEVEGSVIAQAKLRGACVSVCGVCVSVCLCVCVSVCVKLLQRCIMVCLNCARASARRGCAGGDCTCRSMTVCAGGDCVCRRRLCVQECNCGRTTITSNTGLQ